MDDRFGTWLKRQLTRRDLTQSDFARAIDRSPGRVSEWIHGKRIPDPQTCDVIADALLIDLDLVLFQAGHRPLERRTDPDDPALEIHGLVDRVDWSIPSNVRLARSVLTELVRETKESKL